MAKGKGLIGKLNDDFDNIEKNFDISKSKTMYRVGWGFIIIGLLGVLYGGYYGVKKAYKAITKREMHIILPTEPQIDYRNSISNGRE
ncbi:hypothetical protein J4465_00455 [Candidatus Pacearchaeota archaeon]|nr:hypothetical protein [Candidatus Pacearchaeota archaeon]